ncbi:MAG: hypothetical protein AABX97_02920 [Candidatus Thermoplasmatota archaeon]
MPRAPLALLGECMLLRENPYEFVGPAKQTSPKVRKERRRKPKAA